MKNQFKKINNFNENKFGYKEAETKLYIVAVFDVDADGINYWDTEEDNDDDKIAERTNYYALGASYIFETIEKAREFITKSAKKYAKEMDADNTQMFPEDKPEKHSCELIELSDNKFIVLGETSFAKIYTISEIPNIVHC